jgi:hypothetical protein
MMKKITTFVLVRNTQWSQRHLSAPHPHQEALEIVFLGLKSQIVTAFEPCTVVYEFTLGGRCLPGVFTYVASENIWLYSIVAERKEKHVPCLLPEEYCGRLDGYDLIDLHQRAARAAFTWLCCASLPRLCMDRNLVKRIAHLVLESANDVVVWL